MLLAEVSSIIQMKAIQVYAHFAQQSMYPRRVQAWLQNRQNM